MLFWILLVAIPIYAVSSWMTYRAAADRLVAQAERDADELVARLAAGLDAVVRPIEGGIRTVAAALEEVDPPRDHYELRIRGILAAWPDVYGSTIAAESDDQPFAPYFFRGSSGIEFADLAQQSYAYRTTAWYRRAADSLQPTWSPPYFDTGGGNTWMVTYSVPFFRKQGEKRALAGVVTADLELHWVKEAAARVELGPVGMGWIFSPPAQTPFVAPVGVTAQRAALRPPSPGEETIRDQGERMYAAGASFRLLPAQLGRDHVYLAVRNLETLDWRLMLAIPRTELLADARHLLERHMLLGAFGLAGLVMAIFAVAAGISRPINALARAVGGIREERFDFQLPAQQREDEIGVLTGALRSMRDALKRHIQLRAETLAAEQRLEYELTFAATIQQSMLPASSALDLPPAAGVHAMLLPAKRVGGDFYDCFAIRGGQGILFAVGDVSDKGIPAALSMARLSSLLRLLGTTGESPDQLLADVNARFSERNEACMFATLACGMLDPESGRVLLASAGHEPPLLRQVDGPVRQLEMVGGAAIGVETAAQYPLAESWLAPGDSLVLFTDGITEAVAPDGALFGIERVQHLLRAAPAGSGPAALIQFIIDGLTAEESGFHATDDLTLLAITFQPPGTTSNSNAGGPQWEMEIPATADGIRQARNRLRGLLAAREVEAGLAGNAELIVEELLTNVVRSAMPGAAPTPISLAVSLGEAEIVLIVRDGGPEFDPLAQEPPQLDTAIEGRSVGGLGIFLVRELASKCRYQRHAGTNVLEVHLQRIP